MRKMLFILLAMLEIDDMVAQVKTDTLAQVLVRGKKPPVQILPDKMVINVDASLSNAGATALELLEKSPGITFDRNGNISLKGRTGVLVMIDGKPTQLTGTDLDNLLTGMTAAQIESIEIIDNPTAKYDAAGNAGIINIKTRKNRQRGFNGNVNLSAAQGKYSRTVNSITINNFAGKINAFTTIGLNVNKNFSDLYAFRKYYASDEKTIVSMLQQPSFFTGRVPSQTLKTGIDYFLSQKTTLGIVFNGSSYLRKSAGTNKATWMNPFGQEDSVILTSSSSRERLKSGAVNFNVTHVFDSNRDLKGNIDYIGYRIRTDQQFKNQNPGYLEDITGNIPRSINIFTGKADYSHKLPNGLQLGAGWKSSHIRTDNRALYQYSLNNNPPYIDFGKTNHFIYEESIHALYTSAEKTIDKMTIQAGLRFENTSYRAQQLVNDFRNDSSFSRRYGGLFPDFMVNFRADSLNNFSFSAGRRIDRPPFQDLNPFVFVINKYTYEGGNPYYRPQYTWNMELSHSFKSMWVSSLSYSRTTDYFSQIFTVDSSGIISYSVGNLDRMQNIGVSVSSHLRPVRWWTLTGQMNLNHKKISGFVWKQLDASLTQFNFNINNQFELGGGWSAELSGFMQLREQELQEITEPTGQLIAGIQKSLFKGRGTLRLLIRDIFYTQAMEGNTIFRGATEYFKITRDSRLASIAFNYRFGKPAKQAPAKRTGGADDEIKRANTTG